MKTSSVEGQSIFYTHSMEMKMSVKEVDALKQEIENKDKLITIYRQKIADLEEELRIQIELARSRGPGFPSDSQSDSKDE